MSSYADGVREADGRVLLELEDLARYYNHPAIMDIKVGRRTWYPGADQAYIKRCATKDAATTQSALGFKICGMQVYRRGRGGYWRASKGWCKTLPEPLVDKALLSFAHNGTMEFLGFGLGFWIWVIYCLIISVDCRERERERERDDACSLHKIKYGRNGLHVPNGIGFLLLLLL